MWRIIVNRLAFGVAIVLLITIVVFGLSRAAGDPRNIYLDEYATPEAWDAWGERMGLDKPSTSNTVYGSGTPSAEISVNPSTTMYLVSDWCENASLTHCS